MSLERSTVSQSLRTWSMTAVGGGGEDGGGAAAWAAAGAGPGVGGPVGYGDAGRWRHLGQRLRWWGRRGWVGDGAHDPGGSGCFLGNADGEAAQEVVGVVVVVLVVKGLCFGAQEVFEHQVSPFPVSGRPISWWSFFRPRWTLVFAAPGVMPRRVAISGDAGAEE